MRLKKIGAGHVPLAVNVPHHFVGQVGAFGRAVFQRDGTDIAVGQDFLERYLHIAQLDGFLFKVALKEPLLILVQLGVIAGQVLENITVNQRQRGAAQQQGGAQGQGEGADYGAFHHFFLLIQL